MATGPSKCPRCGTAVPVDARFCPACGYATARLTTGQTLDGKYEILDKIGEGGMGEVYRARHIHLDEIRIIKVTKPDALGEGTEPRRFQEEARIATLVRHPNVAALYDFSRMPDGASYYMVWEFINGITLEAWLKRYGPLPVGRALDVAQQVLAGLAEIHAQGIVHRDLSPDNIMLKELPDGKLQAKIIDLGIAKRVASESLQFTGTGMFVGKLKYCSPEQAGALPRGQSVDGRSDLYSFGVVLFEMLTGKPPFESQTPEGFLGMHLHQAAPPLDTTRVPPRAGPALAGIVSRALEKSRDKRFKDAKEFSEALSRLTPALTQPMAAIEENLPTVALGTAEQQRRRTVWVVGVLLAAAVAGGIYLVTRGAGPESPAAPTPAPTVEPSPAPPTPRPTETVDEVVVPPPVASPRIHEGTATDIGVPHPQATRRPSARPTPAPTAVPTPVPTAPPTAAPAPAASAEEQEKKWEANPDRAQQHVGRWLSQPVQQRAHRAQDVAAWANTFARQYPDNPRVQQMKRTLPGLFKGETLAALDNKQPYLAGLFYKAYLSLEFAPQDPELDRRMAAAAETMRKKN
jgi:eukaryotic-like serine/threonine-protein kinase